MYSKRKMSYKKGGSTDPKSPKVKKGMTKEGPIKDRKDYPKGITKAQKMKMYKKAAKKSTKTLFPGMRLLMDMNKARKLAGFGRSSDKTYKKGGKTDFGMLSVKAGYDNNPNPTAADRIVGAKKKGAYGMKMKKKSIGMGGMKMKSTYKHGGKASFRGNHQHD